MPNASPPNPSSQPENRAFAVRSGGTVAGSKSSPQIVESNSLFLRCFAAPSASQRYALFVFLLSFFLSSCSHTQHHPNHLVFIIESNPANLDPRYSSDAQSQRIDRLLFDGLKVIFSCRI
jgi:hypothetical protein